MRLFIPVMRMVIGIKNSTEFEDRSGSYKVTIANITECPNVNAVIKPISSFHCWMRNPASKSNKKSI